MTQKSFHTIWLFIFNASLIILTPFIRGPGNYLAFTLIFLGTNILILSFLWQVIEQGVLKISASPLSIVSFLFLAVIALSYLFTINPPSTRYGFFTMASVIINGAFLSFVSCNRLLKPEGLSYKGVTQGFSLEGRPLISEQRLWQGLCAVLGIAVSAFSLFALYQYITGRSDFEGRAQAAFVTPNSFAGYLLLTMPVLMWLYLAAKRNAIIFFLLNMLAFAALLATGTGGRWILLAAAVGTALLLFWLFASPARKRLVLLAIGFLAVLLIFFAPIGNGKVSLSPKPAELSGSTQDRLNIWRSTWEVIQGHPIRGVGFWSFHTIYSKYKNQIYQNVEHYFSHNDYLQLWAELGLIGVGVFLILIYLYFREGFRCLKVGAGLKPAPTDRIMLLSTMIGAFLMLIHTISDFDLYIPAVLFIFWGYIAYTSSTARVLGLCNPPHQNFWCGGKTKVIDFNSFRIFTLLGKKKLYIITAGIFAFLCFWVSDPYLAGLYNARGRVSLGKGEYEKAVKFFSKAVELDPIDDSYHFNLGIALAKYSSDPLILKKAEEEMTKAQSLSPYRSDLYFNMAVFYRTFYLKEKGDAAVEMLKKARELDPVDMSITYNLGVLYLEMKRYKNAIDEFKKYLKEKPDDGEAHIEISEAYRMNKEYDSALKEIDWLLNKNGNNNYAHFLKANILQDIGQYDDAHKEYRLALREKGKEGDVWYAIGLLSLKQNKPQEAEAAFRKAVDYRSLDQKEKRD
ncbi:MAG: tetratricopeptide repeat protein [Deltaproteobacteria bacterium]|nr:tetratricopeptide repeat protein [Deltaproteobacteria bacterium]